MFVISFAGIIRGSVAFALIKKVESNNEDTGM